MKVQSVTPILYVEAIEPCLPFWERLGWTRDAEVPEGDRLGFIILKHGDAQLMLQTRESIEKDIPAVAATPMRGTLLFIVVDDIDAVEAALDDVEIVHPRRRTFYGATEIIVREPAGNVVTFAGFGE